MLSHICSVINVLVSSVTINQNLFSEGFLIFTTIGANATTNCLSISVQLSGVNDSLGTNSSNSIINKLN